MKTLLSYILHFFSKIILNNKFVWLTTLILSINTIFLEVLVKHFKVIGWLFIS